MWKKWQIPFFSQLVRGLAIKLNLSSPHNAIYMRGGAGLLFLKPIEFSFDAKSTTAEHYHDSMKQACFPYSVFNEKSGPGFFFVIKLTLCLTYISSSLSNSCRHVRIKSPHRHRGTKCVCYSRL